MIVNHLKWAENAQAVFCLYLGCILSVLRTDAIKHQFVNASADLTRSLGLLNFTKPVVTGAFGKKEQ